VDDGRLTFGPEPADSPRVGRLALPAPKTLDYIQKLLTVFALVLGLPIVIYMAVKRPEKLAAQVLKR
jgi:hypothetical protein